MTLFRQLALFISLLFLILFSGTWLAKLQSTRAFLVDQLESHAQDTATSLGLSLSQYMADQDMPAMESMINAVFDRGYYRIIRLSDTEGRVLVDRQLEVKIEKVPAWFIRLVPLKTPEVTANVMAGWFHAGSVFVSSHPGYAYKTLWETAVRMSLWFLGTGLVVAVAGGVGLGVLLRPLRRVEEQADALCRKQYDLQEKLPRTKELRRVVEAMNRMTCKVRDMFAEQVAAAEQLRRHAYLDTLTGLGNRRYFESQVTAVLESPEGSGKGALLLYQVHDLQELNQQKGLEAGDNLLRRVSALLQEVISGGPSTVLARLTGGDFAVFLPDASPWEVDSLAEGLVQRMSSLVVEKYSLGSNTGHLGAVSFDFKTSLGRLLSEADLALRAAQADGPNRWKHRALSADSGVLPQGEQQWKTTLERALQERRIVLFGQPVVDSRERNRILHREVFLRIVQEDGSLLDAGVFMPYVERLHLVAALDRVVLEEVMRLDRKRLGADEIAVNIASASLTDRSFREWMRVSLQALSPQAPRIVFEFAEFAAVQHLDHVRDFSVMVRAFGHGIGLDHYGQSFSNLGYLQSLRPDHVKIDRAYTGELREETSDSRFFVSSLCSVAHSLDIAVIAEGVEEEQMLSILESINVDGLQGYAISRPEAIS